MDLTTVYCNLDDFYRNFNFEAPHDLLLGPRHVHQGCTSLSPSEFMTILVMFHQSQGYRNFKGYYTEQFLGHWHREFPDAPATLVWFSFSLGSFGPWLTTWEVAVVK